MRAIVVATLLACTGVVSASDHLDSEFIDEHPMLDIGDLFLWTGEQTGGPVFMMTFNPLTNTKEDTEKLQLDPEATYQFKIDLDGDVVADLAYKITIIGNGPQQGIVLMKSTGKDASTQDSENGRYTETVATGKSSVAGGPVIVTEGSNGELVFVGPRRDPFFFDFRSVESPAALDLRFALSGDDLPVDGSAANTFGPTNMTIVALEVPELKGKSFTAWGTTSVHGKQADRCGRASITAIFTPNTPPGRNHKQYPWRNPNNDPGDDPLLTLPTSLPKQKYNQTAPVDDVKNYSNMFSYRLEQLQTEKDQIPGMVDFFLPDVLEYDPAQPMAYPNGRDLVEDAVFWTIEKINPFLTWDKDKYSFPASNPQQLSSNFPYAASPVFFPTSWQQPVSVQRSK